MRAHLNDHGSYKHIPSTNAQLTPYLKTFKPQRHRITVHTPPGFFRTTSYSTGERIHPTRKGQQIWFFFLSVC